MRFIIVTASLIGKESYFFHNLLKSGRLSHERYNTDRGFKDAAHY
jgi:hypothetical protein